MKIFSDQFKNLFRKNKKVILSNGTVLPITDNRLLITDNLFTCHHCGNQFEVQDKDIFPTSVRLLYKDQFVTGKGVMCPKCLQNSIFG